MQFFRTARWIVATAILVAFLVMNWGDPVPVRFWPLEGENYMHLKWPIGFVAFAFFLIGFLPMWLLNRTNNWRLTRRISSLEQSIRITASAEPPAGENPQTKDET